MGDGFSMEKEADVPQLHKIAYGKLNHHNFWANVDGCDVVVAAEEWSSCEWVVVVVWAKWVDGWVAVGRMHPWRTFRLRGTF